MASKTYRNLYVAITPYTKMENTFNVLRVDAEFVKGKGFRVSYQPGWYLNGAWGCILDFGTDPLIAGGHVDIMPANRNDQKKLDAMHDNLNTKAARAIIAYLFNVRAIGQLDTALSYIAVNPEWATEEEFNELKAAYTLKDNDESENNNNNNNSNSTTMANVNANDEFRIGRVLMLKNNGAWYTILHKISDDMLQCSFEQKNGFKQEFPVKVANLKAFIAAGTYYWADEKPSEPTASEPTASEPTASESDVEEVNAEEVVDAKPEPVKVKIVQPKAAEPFADEPKTIQTTATTTDKTVKLNTTKTNTAKASASKGATKGKYTYATYTTKKGKTGGKILGFAEDNDIYLAGPSLHASKTWERKNGVRVYTLLFGPRYAEAAKTMCEQLNNGATLADCQAIIEGNTEALAKARAEQKAEYLQRKAEREAEKANANASNTNATASTKASAKGGEKLYTEAEVKERIRKAFEVLAKETGNDIKDFETFIQAA